MLRFLWGSESVHRRRHVWFAWFRHVQARSLCGSKAIGIPSEGITAGTRVTGPGLPMRALIGSDRVMSAGGFMEAIGTGATAGLRTDTNGIAIVSGTVIDIATITNL